MITSQAIMVANELKQMGFQTQILAGQVVKVSLSNRKVSSMEVNKALDQVFGEIEFSLKSSGNGVIVR